MTINELANVHRCNIDNDTGLEISHDEKWGRVVNALGFDEVKACIPFTLEEIRAALRIDKHLNRLHLADSVCTLKCAARMWAAEERSH